MLLALLQVHTHTRTVEVDMRYSLLGWLLIGLIAGWLAGKNRPRPRLRLHYRHRSRLIGSVLGGWLFLKLGILGGGFHLQSRRS